MTNKRIEAAIKRFDRQQGARYGYPKKAKPLSEGRHGKIVAPPS